MPLIFCLLHFDLTYSSLRVALLMCFMSFDDVSRSKISDNSCVKEHHNWWNEGEGGAGREANRGAVGCMKCGLVVIHIVPKMYFLAHLTKWDAIRDMSIYQMK